MELELEALKAYKQSLEQTIDYLGDKFINNYTQSNSQLKHLIEDMQKYTHSSIKLKEVQKQIYALQFAIKEEEIKNQGCSL
jgi:vacuolar-type H+-ATPase subunit D/Vma8